MYFAPMTDDLEYSGVVKELKAAFELFQSREFSALIVCAARSGVVPFVYVPVPEGAWPWGVFDNDPIVRDEGIRAPLVAFDLKGTFEEQFPPHLYNAEYLDRLEGQPVMNIPDRQGHVPSQAPAQTENNTGSKKELPPYLRLVK